mgnify:CR=1 FL=1
MLIVLRDATVTFEGARHPALDRVSLPLRSGSWTAVVGANGSGKSTLLGVLSGLVPLRDGFVERDGTPRVALLPQDADNHLVATSVAHELALSVPHDMPRSQRDSRIAAAVERFDLAHLLERNPHRLSGGEKQRLACATVWLEHPDLLLLDEPLAFLDTDARARVIDFVRETHARGATVVWATPGEDVELAPDAVYLEHGRVVAPPPSNDMHTRPPLRRAAALGARGAVILAAEGASFAFDGRVVLQSIDLQVAKGECVGIVGRNGAGKSTLLTLLGGAHTPASGRVRRSLGAHEVALYLPQTPERMFFAETVREEIAFGLQRLAGGKRNAARIEEIARESLCAVGLDPAETLERSPFQLSFGEMRRVAFAIAHAMAPALLLLDEPASCLDRAGHEVLADLVAARANAGAAVVIASHDTAHLDGLCDRILSLENGFTR